MTKSIPVLLLATVTILGILGVNCICVGVLSLADSNWLSPKQMDSKEMMVRLELDAVWATKDLIEFAKNNKNQLTYPELVDRLKNAGLKDQWFAYAYRVYLGSRKPTIQPVLLRVGQHMNNFPDTLAVLAAMASSSIPETTILPNKPKIIEIPRKWLKEDPRAALESLLERYAVDTKFQGPR